jgi:TonB family protein
MPSDPYDDRTFMEKYGLAVLFAVILLLGGGIAIGCYFFNGKIPPPKKPEEIMVHLLPPPLPPPPPPPPPPKVPPPPQQPKMVELKPQDKTPPKPEAHNNTPPGPPGPKASGPPSDDGIGGGGGGGGDGIDGEGGSVFGFYASQVGDQVRAALGRNAKTRNASFHVKVRIWFDTTGRITRAKLNSSTGDPAVDSAIKDEVLSTLQLAPPPQGMPPTIAMNLNEVRPN